MLFRSNIYRVVSIGKQTWMAENLSFSDTSVAPGKCFNNSIDSCKKYGRLYTWNAVMKGGLSTRAIPSGVEGICPANWHVPSDGEWQTLLDYLAPSGFFEGSYLKSRSDWNIDVYGFSNGTDQVGFRALPGGYGLPDGSFRNTAVDGFWWSATEYNGDYAWYRSINYDFKDVFRYDDWKKNYLFSLRCVKN